ncbi:ankyrin repeat-containing domain protein [Aspergillus californicus]
MPGASDYTVGWICALAFEFAAAELCLDEEHDDASVDVSSDDDNHYTFGRIRKHNVVIAGMPDGEHGVAPAAAAARDMARSFPNIRIGLMVGIGGGVPTRHDIRLGDVVVSSPRDGMGGVYQYDLGKTIQNQAFVHTGFLNQPPTTIRTAIRKLEARYERKGQRISEALNVILAQNPEVQVKYSRPPKESDRLFKADITHRDNCHQGSQCLDEKSNLILRPERTELDGRPMIHYGTIASANQLMKDAIIRDKLAEEKDILCVEMEAAGLMNHFPCLVVRGICDYSDTHKNDHWQRYAALTAALYAKDLLSEVRASNLNGEKRIVELLSDAVSNVESTLELQQRDTILDWLTDFDYGRQLSDYLDQRAPGTGEWFLESSEYKDWMNGRQQILLCPGMPGSGKTIIASIVVDHLNHTFPEGSNVGVAFTFLDHHIRGKPTDLLTDLLRGLLRQFTPLPTPDFIVKLYTQHSRTRTPLSSGEIFNVLCKVMKSYSRTFIIVDALDESPGSGGTRSIILTELFNLHATVSTSILVTSRRIPSVVDLFEAKGSIVREISARDDDVHRFIDREVSTFDSWVRKEPELQRQIMDAVIKATGGMFLLARLHLKSLRDKTTPRNILNALEKLPTGSTAYHEAYDDVMARISTQSRERHDLALNVLSWVTQARRPVRIAELTHALAVTEGSAKYDKLNAPSIELIVDLCHGLLILDPARDAVRLVHKTASEYFEQCWTSWFPNAHAYMAGVLVSYLRFEQFASPPVQTRLDLRTRLQENCLYEYAAHYWGDHARKAYPQIKTTVARFLRCTQELLNAVQVVNTPQFAFGILSIPKGVTGLHIAAYFGLTEEISDLIQDESCLDVADSCGQTALHWAVRNGQEEAIIFLLSRGLDVNAVDDHLESALHYAARHGSKTMIRLFLESGSQVECRNEAGESPLLVAARGLNLDTLNCLLINGANANALDKMDRNAIHLAITASKAKPVDAVKILLEYGLDISLCDGNNMTPLHYAVNRGDMQLIDLLLDAGANINFGIQRDHRTEIAQSTYGETAVSLPSTQVIDDVVGLTPLHFAACVGRSKMTKYLVSKGANPNVRSHYGDTPLHLALRRCLPHKTKDYNHFELPNDDPWSHELSYVESVREIIFEHGSQEDEINQYIAEERLAVVIALLSASSINVNIQNSDLDTPLHLVRYDEDDSIRIVCQLLELGANAVAQNEKDWTALHFACQAGATPIVEELLIRGSSVTSPDYQGLNALHLAVRQDQYETVKAIFSRDEELARFYCRDIDSEGRTLLHHQLQPSCSSTELTSLLLGYGAEVNSVDNQGHTPLSIYLQTFWLGEQIETCRVLLDHGQTLAHLAISNESPEIGVLEALSDFGLDLSLKDRNGQGILHHGVIGGSMSMQILYFLHRRQLLDLYDPDADGKSPVDYAAEEAEKERIPDSLNADRWKHTWENLQIFLDVD